MTDSQKTGARTLNSILGTNLVTDMLIEECSELITALTKLKRLESKDNLLTSNSNKILLDIDEEIADVLITLERFLDMEGNEDRINFMINKKLRRSYERINKILSQADRSDTNE